MTRDSYDENVSAEKRIKMKEKKLSIWVILVIIIFLCIIALKADSKLLIFGNGIVMGMQIMLAIDGIEMRKRRNKE